MKLAVLAASFAVLMGGTAMAQSYTIGLSNGFVGSEWRTQMIDEAQAAADAWSERGVEVELVIQSADTDVQGQIGHIRNFINQGVDAIIINPNSPTAFDPVFAQAAEAGILVIATDAEVSSPDAIYVGIDQTDWARKSAQWLVDAMGGEGNVVAINGVAGNPANEMRVAGYTEVFEANPGITVLTETNANWDQAQGQQAMQNLLATYPEIDGVWVQDGMAAGAFRAIEAAGKTADIAATGEIRKDFLDLWAQDGLTSGASVNPPGVMASAINVAVLRLEGREFKEGIFEGVYGNAIYLPIPLVTADNLEETRAAAEGQPGYYSVSNALTVEEAEEFFQ